jgi:hypothetical protein
MLGELSGTAVPFYAAIRDGDEIIDEVYVPPQVILDPAMVEPFWADQPWYLSALSPEQEDFLTAAGFDRPARERATAGLVRLFPSEICRDMSKDQDQLSLIAGLHKPWSLDILPLLQLGSDLAVCGAFVPDSLLKRLRQPDFFWSHGREIWTWARLLSASFGAEYEPSGFGNKTPEFRVTRGLNSTFVEVKTNPIAAPEAVFAELRPFLDPHIERLRVDDRLVWLRGTHQLGELFLKPDPRAEMVRAFPELRNGLVEIDRRIRSAQGADGTYSDGKWVDVVVRSDLPQFASQIATDLWSGLPIRKLAQRAIRKVREANQQIPAGQRGIVVLDVGALKDIDVLTDLLSLEGKAKPKDYNAVACVVVIASTHDERGFHRDVTVPLSPGAPILHPIEREVVEALLGRSINLPPSGNFSTQRRGASAEWPFGRGVVFSVPLPAAQ